MWDPIALLKSSRRACHHSYRLFAVKGLQINYRCIRLFSMKVLAIETSTMLGGASIMDADRGLVAEVRLNVKATHSERLMGGVDLVLRQAGLQISDIDAFAVSIGPGSFTGLRIGLSTVKGFAYATGRPIVGVPTLEAFAWHFPCSAFPVCVMLDARRHEVYGAVFRWEAGGFKRVIDETSIRPADLFARLGNTVILAGEGAILYRDLAMEILGERAVFAAPQHSVPSPSHVAHLGLMKALRGEFADPVRLVPFYIRKSEAEVKLIGGHETGPHPQHA